MKPTTILELIEMYPELMKEIFYESRKQHAMVGTKFDSFEQYKQSLQRKPLFKDELGNDVFEYEDCFYIKEDNSIDFNKAENFISNTGILFPYKKYFKHKSDAEDYVLHNAPMLSYNDLVGASCLSDPNAAFIKTDFLLELIKSKLAQ